MTSAHTSILYTDCERRKHINQTAAVPVSVYVVSLMHRYIIMIVATADTAAAAAVAVRHVARN